MKKFRCLLIILAILTLTPCSFAQVKNKSVSGKDYVKIVKITPRTLSYLLKPINYKIHAEVDFNLVSKRREAKSFSG